MADIIWFISVGTCYLPWGEVYETYKQPYKPAGHAAQKIMDQDLVWI